ncbi:MAG: hypothetical protein K1Y36_03670 [Blastocatellia bacterium]|nr:hypothetical protein [Blastocatellia bacterium]
MQTTRFFPVNFVNLFSCLALLGLGILFGDTAPVLAQRGVPPGTQMKVRLETQVDSKTAREGDRFRAVVLNPSEYADATLEGHVSLARKSGKIKGQTVLNLVFDRIQFRSGGSDPLRGQVVKVYGEKSVKQVDAEGNLKTGSRGSSTAKRTAGGAAGGAILGAIIGGGKGAAIGAGVGAGAGAGSNVIRDSDRIKLEPGTEMLIRITR